MMTVKELIVLAHFLKDQYGENCEILTDFEDESWPLNGGFRVDDHTDTAGPNSPAGGKTRKVVLL